MANKKKIRYNVVIVGAGGTGSHFISRFSQYLSSKKDIECNVSVVDGDYVEEKNLERQNFVSFDLMQNKAEAICQAVEETYGLTFTAYNNYLDKAEDLYSIIADMPSSRYVDGYNVETIPIIIGCCDNHRCRQVMEAEFNHLANVIYIDSANEFDYGEVVIGAKIQNNLISPSRAFYFPDVLTSKEKSKSELSCGAINKAQPQHLITNVEAANIILSFIVQIFDGSIRGGIVYFNSFSFERVFRPYIAERKEVKAND